MAAMPVPDPLEHQLQGDRRPVTVPVAAATYGRRSADTSDKWLS